MNILNMQVKLPSQDFHYFILNIPYYLILSNYLKWLVKIRSCMHDGKWNGILSDLRLLGFRRNCPFQPIEGWFCIPQAWQHDRQVPSGKHKIEIYLGVKFSTVMRNINHCRSTLCFAWLTTGLTWQESWDHALLLTFWNFIKLHNVSRACLAIMCNWGTQGLYNSNKLYSSILIVFEWH